MFKKLELIMARLSIRNNHDKTSEAVMSDQEKSEAYKMTYNRRNLYLNTACVFTLFIAVGLVTSWSSPSVPKLVEEHHNFTNSEKSLLSSITGLAPGPLITMFGIDSVGRKWTLFIIWSMCEIGYIMMLISTNIYVLLVARFITGWGMGAAFSAIGIYIAETADMGVRGPLNSGGMFFWGIGNLITYSVGPFVSFMTSTLVSLAVTSVFGILWFFLPESPYYYVRKEQIENARSSIKRLRLNASSEYIEKEIADIKFSFEEERKMKTGFKKLLTSKAVYKQFGLSLYLLYLQQGSGLNPMGAYTQEIFDKAKLDFPGAYVPIGMGLISMMSTLPAPFLLKKFGNKVMFMVGGFGSGIFSALMGINFLLLELDYDLSAIRYSPIVIYFLVILTTHVGLGGSVWATVSELFAPSVKGLATGICGILSTLLGFVFTEVFGELKVSLELGKTFIGFGVLQCIMSLGLFFMVDTTKMTLQEIQDYFEGKKTHQDKHNK